MGRCSLSLNEDNSPSRYSKMHRLQNKHSSSSSCDAAPSSSPKSSSVDSTAEYNVGDINFFRNRCGLGSQPRLSRQRKLRYLSDREVGISWNNELKEYVMTKSMSLDPSTARFSSVVPHPLPLPERRESGLSSSGNCPLSSPKKRAASRGDAEEGNKTNSCIGDESGDADNPDFSLGR